MEPLTSPGPDALTYPRLHKLLHDLHEHERMALHKNLLLGYVFLLLVYVGLNAGLLGANFADQDFIEENYYLVFHMLSFWGVFAFTLLEAFILIISDTVLFNWKHKSQSVLILFNVLFTFATAILFSIFPEKYETPSHYMEYSVQILISTVNGIFVWNYIKSKSTDNVFYRYRYLELSVAGCVIGLSVLQLIIFSGRIHTGPGAERSAHFCEFVNEIFNGLFALFYATLTYMDLRDRTAEHVAEMHKAA